MIIVGIYVDDLLFIVNRNQLTKEIKTIKEQYVVRVNETVNEYVGCEIWKTEEGNIILHQNRIIEGLAESFDEEIKNLKTHL